jgi:hypothetical protein
LTELEDELGSRALDVQLAELGQGFEALGRDAQAAAVLKHQDGERGADEQVIGIEARQPDRAMCTVDVELGAGR